MENLDAHGGENLVATKVDIRLSAVAKSPLTQGGGSAVVRMLGRLRGAVVRLEVAASVENCAAEPARRLAAVARLADGDSLRSVAQDAEVPGATVVRWCEVLLSEGMEGLVELRPPISLPEENDAETLAQLADSVPEGLEKTVYSALSSAYRGCTVDELASYYHVDGAEVDEWVGLLRAFGTEAIAVWFRRPGRRDGDDNVRTTGRLSLSKDYSSKLLRHLSDRSSGGAKRLILAIALTYEGRTAQQIATSLGISVATIRAALTAFRRNGVYGLCPSAFGSGHVPFRKGFSASALDAVASSSPVEHYARRLRILADAYRGISWRVIAERHGVDVIEVRRHIRAFEANGPEGLAHGEATLTPPLRDDYDAAAMRIHAARAPDDTQEMKLLAIARLYEGETMFSVAQSSSGMTSLRVWIDAFRREGHRFPEPFKASFQAPSPPPRRLPPMPAVELPPHLISPYLQNVQRRSRKRLEAIFDLASGVAAPIVCEKYSLSDAKLRLWVEEANLGRIRWLAPTQTSQWLEDECIPLLRRGIHPAKVAATIGIDEAFVQTLQERIKLDDAIEYLPTGSQDVADLPLAARSWSEPLASYAKALLELYKSKRPRQVMERFNIETDEFVQVLGAFTKHGVAGIACDPARLSASRKSRNAALKRGVDFGQEAVRVPIIERITSYIHLSSNEGLRALRAIALASEGIPQSMVASATGSTAAEIVGWVSRYNSYGAAAFVDPARRDMAITGFRHTGEYLSTLAPQVGEKLLARNIAIVADVSMGKSVPTVCDLHGVTYGFVEDCVDAYRSKRIAGLATMPLTAREMIVAQRNSFRRSEKIECIDDGSLPAPKPPSEIMIDRKASAQASSLPRLTADEWRKGVKAAAEANRLPDLPVHLESDVAIHLHPVRGKVPGALIALPDHTIRFGSKEEAISPLLEALNHVARFGAPGIIMLGYDMVGRDGDGEPIYALPEDTIGGDADMPPDAFVRLISDKLDRDALPAIQRSEYEWFLVPFFRVEVEPDVRRVAVLRAQMGAHDFWKLENGVRSRRWIPSTISLTPNGRTWRLRETSFDIKRANGPQEMYDILYPPGGVPRV